MRIAVLSDTHLSEPDDQLLALFRSHLETADLVLHLGDHVGWAVWEFFNAHPRFVAVAGNCDHPALQAQLPRLRQVEVGAHRIGMAHGWGARAQVGATVAAQFPDATIIVYGHTHKRHWQRLADGRFLLNPGSLFWPRDEHPGGLAFLCFDGPEPSVQWVNVDQPLSAHCPARCSPKMEQGSGQVVA